MVVRNHDSARAINERFGVYTTTSFDSLPKAELYILAVSDAAIAELSGSLIFPENSVVAHPSGATPLEALSPKIEHRAVIYPMQSFSRDHRVEWSQLPIFIEGSTPHATTIAKEFALQLSSEVHPLTSQQRISLHIAAVFGCNFTNAMLTIAAQHLRDIDLPLSALRPLLEHTIDKAMSCGEPSQVQTGPAVRGDISTQNSHLNNIEDCDQQEIYKLISSMIWKTSKRR